MDINGSIDESFSWLEWYLMRDSAPKINSQAKKKLFETFDSTKTEDQTKMGIDEGVTSVITPDMPQLLEVSTIAVQVPSMEEYRA